MNRLLLKNISTIKNEGLEIFLVKFNRKLFDDFPKILKNFHFENFSFSKKMYTQIPRKKKSSDGKSSSEIFGIFFK